MFYTIYLLHEATLKDIRPAEMTWTIARLPFLHSTLKRSNRLQTFHMGWNKLPNFWCKMG